MSEHLVVVDGIEARSVADCPHKLRSPEGMAWCRDFASAQARHNGFRADAKAAADARIESLGLKPANPMADMMSSFAKDFVPSVASSGLFNITHRIHKDTTTWTMSVDVTAFNSMAASALAPPDRPTRVRTIAGKPAGLKAKTIRRVCVSHPAYWADSCRKCKQ